MTPLDEASVERAPAASGAYRLYLGETVIFVGIALDVRAALLEHVGGRHGECTRRATGFDYETSNDPVALQRRWLAAYASRHPGALPECNARQRKNPKS